MALRLSNHLLRQGETVKLLVQSTGYLTRFEVDHDAVRTELQ